MPGGEAQVKNVENAVASQIHAGVVGAGPSRGHLLYIGHIHITVAVHIRRGQVHAPGRGNDYAIQLRGLRTGERGANSVTGRRSVARRWQRRGSWVSRPSPVHGALRDAGLRLTATAIITLPA